MWNRNKRFPEGSITTAFLQAECITYFTSYVNEEDARRESSGGGPNPFNLSVVSAYVQPYGRLPSLFNLSDSELVAAHWTVLQHCEEVEYYLNHHLQRVSGDEDAHKRRFPDYFLRWMTHLQREQHHSYKLELHLLSGGPQSHRVRAGCLVNGVKFLSSSRDEDRTTQNNGVMVEGDDFNYYGVVDSVIELIYGKGMTVVLFKCRWYNNDPSIRRNTAYDRGLLSLNTNTLWYEDEPFILATMAKQVFYLNDPVMGEGWRVVQHMSHRGIYSPDALRLDNDEERDVSPSTDQPIEPYQEQYPHDVPGIQADVRMGSIHDIVRDGLYTVVSVTEVRQAYRISQYRENDTDTEALYSDSSPSSPDFVDNSDDSDYEM